MNEFDKIWNETMGCGACDVKPCEDAVSREAVLELAKKGILVSNDNYKCVVNAIKSLPSVTPQRPKGKWIKCKSRFGVEYFKCSECGKRLDWVSRDDNYCCNCGSDNSESTKELFKEWDTRIAKMNGGSEE